MDRRAWRVVLLLVACCGGMVGCSTDASHGTVSGTVTLDGQPLKSGLVRFVPVDGQTATADAAITDGEFTAEVPAGDKRVSISAPKVVGQRKAYETSDAPTIDIVEELLPARYNAQSELTLTVTAGRQQAQFDLTTR